MELLESDWGSTVRAVSEGGYVLWLGSGISRNSVEGLDGLVRRVLVFLHERVEWSDEGCRFKAAFEKAIGLAELDAVESSRFDFTTAAATWLDQPPLVARLVTKYSLLLDVRVANEEADYLLWEAVDVRSTYPPDAAPDCEHFCLAILALEGVVPELVSANWDSLVEAAIRDLAHAPSTVIAVRVLEQDFREPDGRTNLLKFHGCAVLAGAEPSLYRSALIGSQSQITNWPTNPQFAVMRDKLRQLAATRPTLMVGLSAQDSNIQWVFSAAKDAMRWPWPSDPPAHVFSEESLGAPQENILKVVYADDYTAHGPDIEESALIRAFAKSLLTALVLCVVTIKLQRYLDHVRDCAIPPADLDRLARGLGTIRNYIADQGETDPRAFIEDFVRAYSRAMTYFRSGGPSTGRYQPLSGESADRIPGDPNLETSGIPELAAGVALLGAGLGDGLWNIDLGANQSGTHGAVRLLTAGRESAIFFVANAQAAIGLQTSGLIEATTSDAVVIYSTDPGTRAARNPGGIFGRTGRTGPRDVRLGDLLRTAPSPEHLMDGFRHAAAL